MHNIGVFPFGEPVRPVEQQDRAAKRVFVLGVYASAVHARWRGPNSKVLVQALAVASEPYIFWRGDGAEEIISRIVIPNELGTLEPASPRLNGPSGTALDDLFLAPLGLSRSDAWLCDLVPHSCVNPNQAAALRENYLPLAASYSLPLPSVPVVPSILADGARRKAILDELRQSQASILILLGDEPIRWFLQPLVGGAGQLRDFGVTRDLYGCLHRVTLPGNLDIHVLPLAHPRQAARLGSHSSLWSDLHSCWVQLKQARC